MLYTFLKKYTLLLCLLLASLSGQAKETDPEIQRRIATGTKELKAIIAQNAWNNARGLSHLNRYVFGNTKWIKVHQQAIDNSAAEAINALLVKYNEQAAGGKPYVYNAVKLYVYLGGIQGFKAPKPAKNETIAQTIARMKREGDRRLYEYTQYQTALRKEYKVLKGIMKSAPAAFQKSTYQMLAGLAMYLDVYPEKIALKPNEVLVAGIHGILPNASLSKTDGAIAPVLRSQMRPYMKAVIKEQPQLTPTEARQRRAQATQKLVEALLAQLGNYHPVKNPAKIDLNAEMPKLLTMTHQAAKVEAMQSQVPTQAQSELAGKVEVWNYTGLKAKGFRWAATEDDKMRAEFVKKIVLVVTNSHTSRSTLFDIANRRGRFDPGDDEMVFWVHYTDARHHTATFWYSQQVEEALQALKANAGVRKLFEQMMRRGVDEMGKSLTQVCGAVHYVTRMLTNCIKAGQIPEKYWNREHKDYIKSMRWVLAIVAMDFSGGELATRHFALSCGLWNGTLKTVGDITGLVSMFTGYVSDPKLRSQMDAMFKTLKDKGFFNLIGEQFGKHFNALGKINHKSFYLLGEDIIFILSMATGAGELGLFAKGGKLAKLGQGLNGAVKGGKAALTVAQNSFRVLRRQLAGQVKFVYRKTTQAYDIVASGKVIATLQGGKIKVKRWINTTQDKILHPKSMDNSPDGKFIAKNEKGEYGVCKADGRGNYQFEQAGFYASLKPAEIQRLRKVKWNNRDEALDLFIHAEGKQHFAYLENAQGNLQKIDVSTQDLASIVRTIDPGATKPIRLLSCSNMSAAQDFSKALGNRPIYATDAIVRVHADGGITTIARSGSKTSKWRKLQNGNDVGRAPKPKKPSRAAKKEFVEMGQVKLPNAVEKKLAELHIDKAEFMKDYSSIQQAVEANPGLIEGWKVLSSDVTIRTDAKHLQGVYEHLKANPSKLDEVKKGFETATDKRKFLSGLKLTKKKMELIHKVTYKSIDYQVFRNREGSVFIKFDNGGVSAATGKPKLKTLGRGSIKDGVFDGQLTMKNQKTGKYWHPDIRGSFVLKTLIDTEIAAGKQFKAFKASWNQNLSDNLDNFNAALQQGLSKAEAAKKTWTGIWLDKNYKLGKITDDDFSGIMNPDGITYQNVNVKFNIFQPSNTWKNIPDHPNLPYLKASVQKLGENLEKVFVKDLENKAFREGVFENIGLVKGWEILYKSGNARDITALYKAWLGSIGVSPQHLLRIDKFGDEALKVYRALGKDLQGQQITVDKLQDLELVAKWFQKQELDYLWGLKGKMKSVVKRNIPKWNRMKEVLGIDLAYQIVIINKTTRGNRNCVYCSLSTDYLLKGGELVPVKFNPPKGTSTPSTISEKWFGRKYSNNPTSIKSINTEMKKLGDGATGIIACKFNNPQKTGHALNVVNIKGNIWVIDAQAVSRDYLMTLDEFFQKFHYIHLMNTTGVMRKKPPLSQFKETMK
ncbi:toxin glutamine deamidase domain-containing protein [Microscilla marina]|nr:toxin glutamine deamidase domain-containing protein [Microscilla marina]